MPRRLRLAVALIVLTTLAALATAPEATARVDGPCTAAIGGQDVSERDAGPLSDPIEVDDDAPVSVTMSSTEALTRLKVEIEFGGVRWEVQDRESTGTSWASEVPVHDYAVYGVGLYKVVGTSYGQGFTCTAAALIDVQGDEPLDPLVTVVGLVGLTAGLVGLFGVLAVTLRAGQTGAVSVLGSGFFGLILGAGLVVLFQQFSVLYPTIGVTGAMLAGGAAVGLVFSLFGVPARSDAR
jgi:FtsH-binding integral membrane protein